MMHNNLLAGSCRTPSSAFQPDVTLSDMIASGSYKVILGIEAAYRAVTALLHR